MPGQADCTTAPALDVPGVTMVDAPDGLVDPDTVLSVAEVMRIAGGCLFVEYTDLGGRSVADIRELLASEPTVFAVSEPARGFAPDHDTSGTIDDTAHYDDTEPHLPPRGACCEQWHLTQDITGVPKLEPDGSVSLDPNGDPVIEMPGLWQGWVAKIPVTVAVLDTGVDVRHTDLSAQLAAGQAGGCHGEDSHSHGTHVAGIAAAEAGNGAHVAGVAPDAKILPVSVARHRAKGSPQRSWARCPNWRYPPRRAG